MALSVVHCWGAIRFNMPLARNFVTLRSAITDRSAMEGSAMDRSAMDWPCGACIACEAGHNPARFRVCRAMPWRWRRALPRGSEKTVTLGVERVSGNKYLRRPHVQFQVCTPTPIQRGSMVALFRAAVRVGDESVAGPRDLSRERGSGHP